MLISFPKDFCTYLKCRLPPIVHVVDSQHLDSHLKWDLLQGLPRPTYLNLSPTLILYLNSQSVYLVTPFVITYFSVWVCFCVSLLLTYQLRVNTMFHSLKSPSPKPIIHRRHTISVYWINTKIAMWLNMVIRQDSFYICKKEIRKKKPP